MPKTGRQKRETWEGRARRALSITERLANENGYETTYRNKSGLDEFMAAIERGDLRIVAIELTKTTINSDADIAVLEN